MTVPSPDSSSESPAENESREDFFVVGLGASAGGVEALKTFFDHLPDDSGMAFVVIQHLDPTHSSELPSILQHHTEYPVEEVEDHTQVSPNHVYVIPPEKTLSIENGHLRLSATERLPGHNVPIDLFFRSLAENQGQNAVGIVLSGTGSEGAMGLRAIHEAGGFTLVQDPEDAGYRDMPHNAIATGIVDAVLPASRLADRLFELKHVAPQIQLPRQPETLATDSLESLHEILTFLRSEVNHDFTNYKHSTVLRRINRRMQVNQVSSLEAYLEYLKQAEDEAEALFKELLISVTQFFRDSEAFGVLENDVLPSLIARKELGADVRAWVPGCATGEEAYSITMLLMEQVLDREPPPEVQVFATDVDEEAIELGRTGLYPTSIEADLSPERLKHYFEEKEDGYRVRKRLRERVVFSTHDLLQDPPFSNLDLVSCRNVLIYLQPEIQKRLLDLFHYALRDEGILFLGPSESVSPATDLFSTVDKAHSIFQRRAQASGREVPSVPLMRPRTTESVETGRSTDTGSSIDHEEIHWSFLESFAPPSLLVDGEYDILHVSEGGQRYLEYPVGEPTENVLEVIRPELRVDLRTALFQVFRADAGDEEEREVQLELDGTERHVRLQVRRVEREKGEGLAIIVFEEQDAEAFEPVDADAGAETTIQQLEEELDQTREQLALTIEEYESKTEDLKASNEELQSMNEELKSTTEELETSKEELQSLNEELVTVNQELKAKNDELAQANSDLTNLISSTGIGVIFLDEELCLRRYTQPAKDLFNFIPADEGRPLSDLRQKIDYDEQQSLAEDARRVLETHDPIEREIRGEEEQWFLVRLLPYQADEDVDGIVLTFIDITSRKQAELALRKRTREVRNLSAELTMAEQKERDRISKVLHDELQQELHALQMWVRSLETDAVVEEHGDLLEQMKDVLQDCIAQTRSLTAELSPPVLDDETFGEVLNWLALHMEDTYGLEVALDVPDPCSIPRRELRTLLFRLLRELLFNVVKHAEVDEARLHCRHDADGQLVVEVSDEGKGFEADQLDLSGGEDTGFGLYNVRSRVDMFGGDLTIESTPGEGTRVTIVLPLDEPDDG